MADLKLAKLPDRNPVKFGIQVSPQLHIDLQAYAALYKEVYGREEAIVDLIPSMLAAFIDSDRVFAQTRTKGGASR